MNSERAFTGSADGLAKQLVSFVGISLPNELKDINLQNILQFRGIWDTGATSSVITQKIVQKLDLKPIGKTQVQGVTGVAVRDRFLVNFYLPNKVVIPNVSVTECDALAGDFEILIGMDIIGLGDFAVTNYQNKTVFSFRTPSLEQIDFVKSIQLREFKKQTDSSHFYGQKVGRNDPCPCGSGQKFKKCHGK